MSLSFVLPGAALPDTASLTAAVPRGANLAVGAARADRLGEVHVEGRSTRGVLVRWEVGAGLVLELRPLSSEEDLRVAVEMALYLAQAQWLPIKVGARTTTIETFRELWTAQRQARHVLQDEAAIRDLAQDSSIRVDGTTRTVVLGPRLLGDLPEEPGAVVQWLRDTQWLEGAEPLALPAEPLGGDPAAPKVIRLEPGARVLLAPADLVALPGDITLYVPHGSLLELLGDHARYLDESQILVERIPRADWLEIQSRAESSAVADPARWQRRALSASVVLPELRPPSWTAIDGAVVWPLFGDRQDGLPLVSLVEERSPSRAVVAWSDLGRADPRRVQARAIQDLEARLPGWESERGPSGRTQAVALYDEYASEALLSEKTLAEAHRLLGADALVAAAPVRGALKLERADGDPSRLLDWAESTWQEATHGGVSTPLTPHLMLIVDGRVVGRANESAPSLGDADAGSIEMPGLQREDTTAEPGTRAIVSPERPFRADSRAILALALPALGSLAVEPLVALVDTAFVASLGDAAVGALGVAGAILSLAFVVFNFLAYGTTPLVAEARARGDREEAGRTILAALSLAAIIGSLGTVVVFAGAPIFVMLMGATGDVAEAAISYLSIRAIGAPALLLIIAGHGAFRGFQDTATPLVVSLGVAIVNLILDAALLLGLGWGVEGAAIASVIAQWVGAFGFLALILGPQGRERGVPRTLPRPQDLLRLLGVGSVLSVRTLAVVGVMAFAAAVATRLGDASIAAHQVVHQLWMAAALLADGLAVAAQALVASAPSPAHQRRVAGRLLIWGFTVGIALTALLLIARLLVPFVFSVSDEALALAEQAILIAALVQPVAALVFVGDGLYLGARRFGFAAWTMVMASVIGVAGLWVIPSVLGLVGVWVALAIFVGARLVLLAGGAVAPAVVEPTSAADA